MLYVPYQEVEEVEADGDVAEADAVDGLSHHLSGQIGQTQDEVRPGHAHRSGHYLKTINALSCQRSLFGSLTYIRL